jgi:hypothetical protein
MAQRLTRRAGKEKLCSLNVPQDFHEIAAASLCPPFILAKILNSNPPPRAAARRSRDADFCRKSFTEVTSHHCAAAQHH